MEMIAVKASMRTSTPIANPSGRVWLLETNDKMACAPQYANRIPNAPPSTERVTLSVSNCRTIRVRRAPKAMRTPISRCRVAERASIRPARLAQAINKMIPTATIRT